MRKLQMFIFLVLTLLLPSLTTADQLFPLTHCRLVDTRFSTPPVAIALDQEYIFSAILSNNTSQGGEANDCNVPPNATAIFASVVVINPTGPGYLKLWNTGGIEPQKATGLNFFKVWDTAVPNYPVSPGRLVLMKLNSFGQFSVESYWFGAGALVVDVEGYLVP